MSVRVRTKVFQGAGGSQGTPDTYFDKIVKYIPSDVVGAWVAAVGMINAAAGVPKVLLLWICFFAGIAFTAFWKYRQTELLKQMWISTGAFVVWIFALPEGPFTYLGWYHPLYGSLLLIGYTLVTARVDADQ